MPDGTQYIVQQGDCISSIAEQNGLLPDVLLNANPELKAKRKNPNTLLPGDELLIPRKLKQVSAATDMRHKFVVKRPITKLRLVVERYQKPLANKKYVLNVEEEVYQGTTTSTGMLECELSTNALSGVLRIPDEDFECQLQLGYLDPLDEISGAQARLENLGYYHGEISGLMDDYLQEALELFQSDFGLSVTGALDAETKQKLLDRHDREHDPPETNQPPQEASPPTSNDILSDESDLPSEEQDNCDFEDLENMEEDED